MTPTPTTQKTVQPWLLTVAYYLTFVIFGLATALEGPSLPTLAKHTFSALDQISLIFVVGGFGYLIGSIIGGRAYDRLPGHRIISGALAVMVLAAVVYPLASAQRKAGAFPERPSLLLWPWILPLAYFACACVLCYTGNLLGILDHRLINDTPGNMVLVFTGADCTATFRSR